MRRSDPADTADFHGADAPALLAEGAAGEKVPVRFVPVGQLKSSPGQPKASHGQPAAAAYGVKERTAVEAERRPAADTAKFEPSGQEERCHEGRDGRHREREWDGERHRKEGHRERDRGRNRDRDRDRDRGREGDRVRERERGRDRADGGRRHRSGERERHREEHDRGDRKRSRERSAEGRSAEQHKHADGCRADAAAQNGKAGAVPEAEKPPGVVLEVMPPTFSCKGSANSCSAMLSSCRGKHQPMRNFRAGQQGGQSSGGDGAGPAEHCR